MNVIAPSNIAGLSAVIRQQLRNDRPNAMHGWTDPERGIDLAKFILQRKPNVVVEIGVFGGRSLIAIALALRTNGHGKIYGIDPWKKEACFEGETDANQKWWASVDLDAVHTKAMQDIWELRLDDLVCIIRAASHTVVNLFPVIDFLSIDGCHSEISSCRDVEHYVPRVSPKGLIFMDDTNWPSTQKAIRLMEQTCSLIKDYGSARIYEKRA